MKLKAQTKFFLNLIILCMPSFIHAVSDDKTVLQILVDASIAQELELSSTQMGELICESARLGDDFFQTIFDKYVAAAESNDPLALCNLAQLNERGLGTKQNYSEALRFYTLSASQGNLEAPMHMLRVFEKIRDEQKNDMEKSISELEAKTEDRINELDEKYRIRCNEIITWVKQELASQKASFQRSIDTVHSCIDAARRY